MKLKDNYIKPESLDINKSLGLIEAEKWEAIAKTAEGSDEYKYKEISTTIFTPANEPLQLHPSYTSSGAKQSRKYISDDDKDITRCIQAKHGVSTPKSKSRRLMDWRGLIHKGTSCHKYIETANRKYRKFLLRWNKFDKTETVKGSVDKLFEDIMKEAESHATDKQFDVLGRCFCNQTFQGMAKDLGISKQGAWDRFNLLKKKLRKQKKNTNKKLDKALLKETEHIWEMTSVTDSSEFLKKQFVESNKFLQNKRDGIK